MPDDKSEKKTLKEILSFLPTLVNDIKKADEKLEVKETLDDEQYFRRTYVRTFLPMLEGIVYGTKMALFGITCSPNFKNINKLNDPDVFILRGLTYDLKRNGQVHEIQKYFNIEDDLKFTVKSFNRVLGANINLGVGTSEGWDNFIKTKKIRNSIVHPKNSTDLNISNEDWERIRSASSWFYDIFAEMLLALQDFSKNQKCSVDLKRRDDE